MRRLVLVFVLGGCLACGGPDQPGNEPRQDAGTSARFDSGGPATVCGNGIVEQGEDCDDGNRFDDDNCSNTCQQTTCGDGLVNPQNEACDDGNRIETDACLNDCRHARCGDGITRTDLSPASQGAESCDDGNQIETDACLSDCSAARCGDGIARTDLSAGDLGYEACDDGNMVDDDACRNDCTAPSCGDGVVSGDEACDDGNQVDTDACLNTCVVARCGDGIARRDLQPSEPDAETCDDANLDNEDACTNGCVAARCGDGITRRDIAAGEAGFEACDDGNQIDSDACSNSCQMPICGNRITEAGEACDDGNQVDTDACRNTCVAAACGDGITREDIAEGQVGHEACDDGNRVDSDACLNTCQTARCGDGVRRTDLQPDAEGYEICDDGNDDPADACASCRNTCALHTNCRGDYGRCRVAAQEQRGACFDLRHHACGNDRDCEFVDAGGNTTATVCQNNRCVVREFNACLDQVPCADNNACQDIGNSRRCVQRCQNNQQCRTRWAACQTEENTPFCWYSLCGARTELSSDFENINNGRLGGACANDSDNPMDGHCYEVSAGEDQWVGLCIEGGTLEAGSACEWGVARANDRAQCGGGLICTGFDRQNRLHCRQTCSNPRLHGGVRCQVGSTCMPALEGEYYVYACIPVAEQCSVLQRSSCGNEGRCATILTGSVTSHCEPRAPVNERVNAGEACADSNQCPDGYYCNQDEGCRRLCEGDNDCDGQNTCQRAQGAAFGGCEAPAP